MTDLQTFLTTGVFAFIMAFTRLGTAIMVMPGIGNTFVPGNVRLYFALGFAFIFFPVIQARLPAEVPGTALMMTLLMFEFVVGLFIGMVSRVLMSALDVAGLLISMQASLANAQLFNPGFASQGSIIGTFLTIAGMTLLFTTDLHHLMILSLVESYDMFPVGKTVDLGSMSELLTNAVAGSFMVGVQMSAPWLVLVLLLYVGMGVMSKLMPQVQVFMIAVPVQIWLALVILALVFSTMMLVWLDQFSSGMKYFLSNGG